MGGGHVQIALRRNSSRKAKILVGWQNGHLGWGFGGFKGGSEDIGQMNKDQDPKYLRNYFDNFKGNWVKKSGHK
jgi:hypothetical protein